jgi:hypothetical protein
MKPKEIKRLQRQSQQMRVHPLGSGRLLVESRRNVNAQYVVTIERDGEGSVRGRCTCPWALNGGYGCSHVMAALSYLAARKQRAISFWPNRDDAERQRHRILHLLGDLSPEDTGLWITTRPEPMARVEPDPRGRIQQALPFPV